MAKTECAYGFSCASMLMQPGLEAKDCENREVCGLITKLSPDEEIELRIAAIENNVRYVKSIWINGREAALKLLHSRGRPQSAYSLGVEQSIRALREELENLESTIEEIQEYYIAPPNVDAHVYSVKRPYATYRYNKLSCPEAIFEPSSKLEKVKVIHLSRLWDARNLTGRCGIEARNRLLAIKSVVDTCTDSLRVKKEEFEAKSIEDKVIETLVQRGMNINSEQPSE